MVFKVIYGSDFLWSSPTLEYSCLSFTLACFMQENAARTAESNFKIMPHIGTANYLLALFAALNPFWISREIPATFILNFILRFAGAAELPYFSRNPCVFILLPKTMQILKSFSKKLQVLERKGIMMQLHLNGCDRWGDCFKTIRVAKGTQGMPLRAILSLSHDSDMVNWVAETGEVSIHKT